MRMILLLALAAPAALARPPEVLDFERIDELEITLLNKKERFRLAEEFARKPREEKLILLFQRQQEKFEGKKLTGEYVVKELLEKWAVWKQKEEEVSEDAKRIVMLLPQALAARYTQVVPIPKSERYKASKPLVAALSHKNFHVRKAAISCLEAIYSKSLLYKADASPGSRYDKQKKWRREIEKYRK